jgi:hypothetical protein
MIYVRMLLPTVSDLYISAISYSTPFLLRGKESLQIIF